MRPALRNLCLLHFFGTAALLAVGYYWLGIGESSVAALIWSATIALVALTAALWLHAAALAHFHGDDSPWKTGLRRLPPLAAVAVGAAGICLLLAKWQAHHPQRAYLLLLWWVIPARALPLAAGVVGAGWSGFHWRSWRPIRRWTIWVEVPLLLLCALWLPWKLIHWVPRVNGFWFQMTSFVLRASLAYALLVGALLLLDCVCAKSISLPAADPDPAN